MSRRSLLRVLVIESSTVAQAILRAALEVEGDIKVVGTATDAREARTCLLQLDFDVITLAVALPGENGLSFLRELMQQTPRPVVVVSSYAEDDGEVVRTARALGAVSCVTKPQVLGGAVLADMAVQLRERVRAAAAVDRKALEKAASLRVDDEVAATRLLPMVEGCVVGIGASTGGVEAVQALLRRLPAVFPPIVLVQHLGAAHVAPFARRLGQVCRRPVVIAEDGAALRHGYAYVAPGDAHLEVDRRGHVLHSRVWSGPRVQGHRPSVDVLFASLARSAGALAIGVLLSGMGDDGAEGLAQIHQANGLTIVQDAGSSVVWGMPGSAVRRGAAQHVVSVDDMVDVLVHAVHRLAEA